MNYTVNWSDRAVSSACRYLSDDKEGVAGVMEAADLLAGEPRPAGSFSYGGDDLRRIRVGRYRVLYEINASARSIVILHVGRIA